MAAKSTEKKTSLEPSEIFCALGLFITDAEIDDLCKDNTGQKLLDWHPLISKNKNSTIESGNSVFGKIISENQVEEEDFIKYFI